MHLRKPIGVSAGLPGSDHTKRCESISCPEASGFTTIVLSIRLSSLVYQTLAESLTATRNNLGSVLTCVPSITVLPPQIALHILLVYIVPGSGKTLSVHWWFPYHSKSYFSDVLFSPEFQFSSSPGGGFSPPIKYRRLYHNFHVPRNRFHGPTTLVRGMLRPISIFPYVSDIPCPPSC
ncbi:hypothetical protein BS17DRAFT_415845 [Gyrodon lividus]|nr:hypothetical protein BS17DRAFT_415845 [Gyrodon lividus]